MLRAYFKLDGELAIPEDAGQKLGWKEGDQFEIVAQDADTFLFRRVPPAPERGWLELLRACPGPLEIPERERDESPPLEL